MDVIQRPPQDSSPHGPPDLRRAPIACRRCRRLRVKCRHKEAQPPCESCSRTGHVCVFPRRGEPDFDRAYRHERSQKKGDSVRQSPEITERLDYQRNIDMHDPFFTAIEPRVEETTSPQGPQTHDPSSNASSFTERWNLLPPFEEVVEGCEVFITSYFQLGFLPKTRFFERLRKKKEDVSVFLLLSILSISARFTPSLIRRYGNGQDATNAFLESAAGMVLDYMYQPSLETIQAFFLMSLAEWGKGDKDRSSTHMGIAVRMAGTLRLHREETYYLPENATADNVVDAEVARRTFWMLENHDNLHSGFNSPVYFSLGDITTLLPCEEREFAFGLAPRERAALMGTSPAVKDSQLTKSSSRSLFATLIQSHNLWGQIARRVAKNEINQSQISNPIVDTTLSEDGYAHLTMLLKDFEDYLPDQHRWSTWNLRGYKAEGLELAYLSVVMMIRLSNIILRRSYVQGPRGVEIPRASQTANETFEATMSDRDATIERELFDNLVVLHSQIQAYFALRSPNQGFPAFVVFCIYICGSLANYLCRSTTLPGNVRDAVSRSLVILETSTKMLSDLQDAWPMAKRWCDALVKAYQNHAAAAKEADRPLQPQIIQADTDHLEASRRSTSHHGGTPPVISPLAREFGLDNTGVFGCSDAGMNDFMLADMPQLQDPWTHGFPDVSLTDDLDSELALYLWPGGDLSST
ncbi:fungal-specific transcription factor domain-containing protein [Exophiala viscosa]|uniref:Fungal-specific transcription factor domain-containing protein n=1 Tax=Exophiala viscosa TaxID=2486360 RepID=A0AAN6E0Q3_9EURO|nr:fungal-specific transcription factor domain-containing protein [Exophiala viscosa]